MSETIIPAGPGSGEKTHASGVIDNWSALDELRRTIRHDRKDLRRQLRHQRQFLAIIGSLFGLFAAGIGAFVGFVHIADEDTLEHNFDRERVEIENFRNAETSARAQFERTLKEQYLGRSENAKLDLFYIEKSGHLVYLNGAHIFFTPEKDINNKANLWTITFYFAIANEGNSPSGKITEKVFMNYDTGFPNSDESVPYKYEFNPSESDFSPNQLPGKYSSTYYAKYNLKDKPIFHNTPWLMKFFYGRGEMAKATFYLSTR